MTHRPSALLTVIGAVLIGAVGIAFCLSSVTSAGAATRLSYVIHSTGVEYVTPAGTTSTFPGHLDLGDRIFGRDSLELGTRTIGYDNGICTVSYDGNVLCNYVEVFQGKGDISVRWLWVDRTASAYGPKHFAGVIAGGTGTYAGAHGQFEATVLADGDLAISERSGSS